MQGIRKRNLRILAPLFVASVFLFYEAHTGVILKEFAEHRLQEFFPEGTYIHIGHISGGIFKNIVSEDVTILPRPDAAGFDIGRIEIGYKLWYPILDKMPFFKKGEAQRKIVFTAGDKKKGSVNMFIELKNSDEGFEVSGYFGLNKKEKLRIKGYIGKKGVSHFHIAQKKGYIDLKAKKENGAFLVKGNVNHIKIQGVDFIGRFSTRLKTENGRWPQARIVFKDAIINYRPFDKKIEFFLSYDGKEGILNIDSVRVDNEIECCGSMRLSPPHYLIIKSTVKNLALEDYFKNGSFKDFVSGNVNGSFILKGPIKEPFLSGHFYIQEGNFGDIRFDSVMVNLKGKLPFVSVYDSRICTEGGYITLGGVIDLTKLKDNKAFESIYMGPGSNFFVWNGWNISKEYGGSSVKAEKFLDEDIRVSFKAHTEEETSKEEERFVGVEHKVKF